eukprot:gene7433-9135_t
MTSIEKILIQGIRSFDPKESSVIDFYSPLTLIVGSNGAGKTTIIECLKYSCTGEMPPNCSSGQAFIHDTKIAGEAEVKAQIKLRFKNPNGKPIVATRTLSLLQKATKQEYRQVDSSLQSYNSEGQKVSKSFRCSDLDKEIPELMGVAKPILKNVIFCHQEESNWPLSESSKLKIKFDEIFAAVRYTKALKAIKDKKKELNSQIKEFKLKLEAVSTNKDHAHRIRSDTEKMENQLRNGNETIENLKLGIVEKRKELDRIKNIQNKVASLTTEVSSLEIRKAEMERAKNHLYQSLTEVLEENDDELAFMKSTFDEELQTMVNAERELASNLSRLVSEKEGLNSTKAENSGELGRLKLMMEQQTTVIEERDQHILEFINRYKMEEFKSLEKPYAKTDVDRFIVVIGDKFKRLVEGITMTEKKCKDSINRLQTLLQDSKLERQRLEDTCTQHNKQLAVNEKKLESLNKEMEQKILDSGNTEKLESDIKEEESTLQEMESLFNQSGFELKLSGMNEQKKQCQLQQSECTETIKTLNLQASLRTRLNIKRNEFNQKTANIRQKFDENKQLLVDVLGSMDEDGSSEVPDTKLLKSKVSKQITLHTHETESKGKEYQSHKEQSIRIQNEIKFISTDLDKKLHQSESIDKKLKHHQIDTSNFLTFIKEIEHNLHTFERSYAILESEDVLYKEYITKAKDNNECSLCSREMKDHELNGFVHKLENHSNDIPEKLKQLKKDIESTSKQLELLNSLKPDFDHFIKLSEEIPELKSKKLDLSTQLEDLISKESVLQKEVQGLELKLKSATNLSHIIDQIDIFSEGLKSITVEIKRDEEEILKQSSDTRTIEELEKEYESITKKSNDLSKEIDQISKEMKLKSTEIYEKKSQILKLKGNLSTLKGTSTIIERIKDSKNELIQMNQTLNQNINENKIKMEEKDKEIEKIKSDLTKEDNDYQTRINSLHKEKNLFSNRLDLIKNTHSKILDVDSLANQLNSIVQEIQDADERLVAIEKDYSTGEASLATIRENLAQNESTKRCINDNLTYRQHLSNIQTIVGQISKKQQMIASVQSPEEAQLAITLTNNINEDTSQLDRLSGQISVLNTQVNANRLELSKAIYKNVDESHKDLLIKLCTSESVFKDLEKYYTALDKALMKYHTLKMEEINRSIKEIWQTTYRGNDIDTIEIRSEETSAAKKTINYRVVMIKGNIELDMRGRCSAGQKVLACLVIRLALAENFCSNCGILALDEPTTNLDRANIESFANALLNIIEARKSQKGFQLIIITHDEEFVQFLSRGNFCDYYWRVTKDANQHSNVERKEISTLQ